MSNIIIFIILLLVGCGRLGLRKPAEPSATSATSALLATYHENLSTYNAATAATNGWPSVTDCDGAVWASVACLGGAGIDISLAEWAPGEIHRRPKASSECYPAESSSTVSRDDLVVYMSCLVFTKNIGALERLKAYADTNDGWMGEPKDANLTLMTPTLKAILTRAINGGSAGIDIEAPGAKDYQDHIEVEEVLLSSAVNGGANGWELALLKSLELQYPNDALFQAALGVYSGDFSAAISLLLTSPLPIPTYVRGNRAPLFADAWWLRTAKLVLDNTKE